MKIIKGPQPFIKLIEEINEQWVKQDRDFGVPTTTDLSITGQSYVRLLVETPQLDRGMAFVAGLGMFDSYARRHHGALYWHTMPTIERVRNDDGWCYRVEMRLLISDNPVVPRLAAEAVQGNVHERI